MPKLNLPRDVLVKIAQGNQRAVFALEQVLGNVGATFPATIEEANALAGSALTVAQAAMTAVSMLAEAIEQLEGAPVASLQVDLDDTAPRAHLGTISSQDADQVDIAGGTAKLSTLAMSGQITSAVTTGTPPLVVASTDKVENLHADQADTLANPTTYPADATDLASCIALVNALKAAATTKGL